MESSLFYLHPYLWEVEEDILLWAVDEQGESKLLTFPSPCVGYLELKSLYYNKEEVEWEEDLVEALFQVLEVDATYEFMEPPMLRLTFSSCAEIDKVRNLKDVSFYLTKKYKCTVRFLEEDRIRRFMIEKNIELGWMDNKLTMIKEEKEFNPLVLSFSIEYYCRDIPNNLDFENAVYLISMCTFRLNLMPMKFTVILLSPKKKIKLEGIDVINVETEEEVYKSFIQVIQDEDPEIIIGENIFTNIAYFYPRLNMFGGVWPSLGKREKENLLVEILPGYAKMTISGRAQLDLGYTTVKQREQKETSLIYGNFLLTNKEEELCLMIREHLDQALDFVENARKETMTFLYASLKY